MSVPALMSIARPDVWLAAPPFLPPGRGGLILIMGGLAMLAVALFSLSVSPRSYPGFVHTPRAVFATAMSASSRTSASQPAVQWPQYVQNAAVSEGLGQPLVLAVQGTRCTLLIEHCRSCRRRKRHCTRERRALQRAARRLSRHAEVREVSCNIDRRHACAFELRMRGRD